MATVDARPEQQYTNFAQSAEARLVQLERLRAMELSAAGADAMATVDARPERQKPEPRSPRAFQSRSQTSVKSPAPSKVSSGPLAPLGRSEPLELLEQRIHDIEEWKSSVPLSSTPAAGVIDRHIM